MKELILTVGFYAVLAVFGLFGPKMPMAEASTDVNLTYIATMTSRVVIASGLASGAASATRIDNWNATSSPTILTDRAGINFQNLDADDEIYCLNSSLVSTDTANANIGFKYTAGAFGSEGIFPTVQYWCKASDAAGAAGVVIVVRQYKRS